MAYTGDIRLDQNIKRRAISFSSQNKVTKTTILVTKESRGSDDLSGHLKRLHYYLQTSSRSNEIVNEKLNCIHFAVAYYLK